MAKILFLYHSVYGHTLKISRFLETELQSLGHSVDVQPLAEGAPDAAAYDAVVIGASIRHGKHNPVVFDYIQSNLAMLEAKPSAFFSVSLVARKPLKNTPETNPYVQQFLAKTPWKPRLVACFGGVLDYQRYGFFDRHIIRFIMRITKGPTDLHTNVEFTNWDAVRLFGSRLATFATTGVAPAS